MDHLLLVDPKQSRKKKFTLVATSILGTLAFCMIAGYCVMQAQQPAHAFQAAFSENILTDLFGVWKKFHQKHYESKEEEAREQFIRSRAETRTLASITDEERKTKMSRLNKFFKENMRSYHEVS